MGLDQGLPLLDQRAELVAGEGHAVEVSEAVPPLHLLDAEPDLLEALVVICIQVGEVELAHAALQRIGGDLCALGPGDQGLTSGADAEHARGLHVVPLLLEEGVSGLLLCALLPLGQPLVLPYSHGDDEKSFNKPFERTVNARKNKWGVTCP